MKFIDKNTKINIELSYREAEVLWALIDQLCDIANDKVFLDEMLSKRQIKLMDALQEKLEEYVNS